MFKHSIKVPRLYKAAAKVAQQVKEEGASTKDLIYNTKHCNLRAIYALVFEVIKKSNVLDYIIRNTQLLIKENRLDPWLARILITELLWGKKRLPSESKPCQTILRYQKELTDCLATFTDEILPKEPQKGNKPRYVRVNTFKLSVLEAIDIFRDEGWVLLRCGSDSDYGSYLATVASLSSDQFTVDMHIKELLVFPPKTEFFNHYLYINGAIVLQDKASCLAPLLLAPPPKSAVLDMCSAPGMKASQLAAMVGKEGTIYAVERDARRFQTLVKLMDSMEVTNIKCINKDVLTLTKEEISNVEYILVDPSCSGSGIMDRLELEDPAAKSNQSRLQSLAGFQIRILRHALLNFENIKRVVYSTCSLNMQENEHVVQQVIQSVKEFKLVNLKERMSSKWFNFGSYVYGDIGTRCLYARPENDLTNGFFIALFERLSNDETNEFFSRLVERSSECEFQEKQNENQMEKDDENGKHKRSKKKKTLEDIQEETTSIGESVSVSEENKLKRKKKKKSSNNELNEQIASISEEVVETKTTEENKVKLKKKNKSSKNELIKKNSSISEEIFKESAEPEATLLLSEENKVKRKKKKKSSTSELTEQISLVSDEVFDENEGRTRKKKKKSDKEIIIEENNEPKKKKSKADKISQKI